VILAAGEGTRLRPLTEDRPKAMVPLFGVPLLHRAVDVLRAVGVKDVVVAVGYRADVVDAAGCRLVTNPDYATTNMVETLFRALAEVPEGEDVIVSYGDIAFEERVARAVADGPGEVTVVVDLEWRRLWELRMEDPLADAETLRLDGDRLLELGEPPESYDDIEGQYIGLIKVRADRLAAFREMPVEPQMYMTAFIQLLIDAGWDVRAATVRGGWLEVDTLDELRRYEELHANGELAAVYRP
jgi:choline kinase